jgi:hypothetical protein
VVTVGILLLISNGLSHSGNAFGGLSFCPFIYSFNGKAYVLDGEPYGTATARVLARADYSELAHLVATEGEYRLLLTNEQDETQHTDSLTLLAVDHRTGTTVILGPDGTVHAFERRQRLSAAHNERGQDVLPFLAENDKVSWEANLEEEARHFPTVDTRNHLVLEFPRPTTNSPVYLVASAATTAWGALQLRGLLGLHGTEVHDFYETLNRSPEALQQLRDWNAREELYQLGVHVRVGGRWERRGELLASGPFVSETRAVRLDLTGVEGDTVRLRVDPPVGFWHLNTFQLAWGENPVEVNLLKARVARDETGRDVRAELASDDGRTLDQPHAPNVTQLVFDAPPVPAGSTRTVFARTHGWYEMHFQDLGSPDVAALRRLEREPGYAVQRAMAEYAHLKARGVLPGPPTDAGGPVARQSKPHPSPDGAH